MSAVSKLSRSESVGSKKSLKGSEIKNRMPSRSFLVKSPPLRATSQLQASVAPPPTMLPQGQEVVCHGLLRNPQPGGGPAPPVNMPDPLVFYSWWNEEVATPPEFTPSGQGMGLRRQVRLHFLPRMGTFQLFTDDASTPPLTLAIEHSDGTSMQAIELHVGAKLDVLGRPMTLRSASAKTIAWIDSEAKRLVKRREGLCAQISKFADVHKAISQCGFTQLYLNRQMTPGEVCVPPTGGKADLARLHAEISALEGLLIRYRS
jgi:hypothetical protein